MVGTSTSAIAFAIRLLATPKGSINLGDAGNTVIFSFAEAGGAHAASHAGREEEAKDGEEVKMHCSGSPGGGTPSLARSSKASKDVRGNGALDEQSELLLRWRSKTTTSAVSVRRYRQRNGEVCES